MSIDGDLLARRYLAHGNKGNLAAKSNVGIARVVDGIGGFVGADRDLKEIFFNLAFLCGAVFTLCRAWSKKRMAQ